jgi:hypothetical protein
VRQCVLDEVGMMMATKDGAYGGPRAAMLLLYAPRTREVAFCCYIGIGAATRGVCRWFGAARRRGRSIVLFLRKNFCSYRAYCSFSFSRPPWLSIARVKMGGASKFVFAAVVFFYFLLLFFAHAVR